MPNGKQQGWRRFRHGKPAPTRWRRDVPARTHRVRREQQRVSVMRMAGRQRDAILPRLIVAIDPVELRARPVYPEPASDGPSNP